MEHVTNDLHKYTHLQQIKKFSSPKSFLQYYYHKYSLALNCIPRSLLVMSIVDDPHQRDGAPYLEISILGGIDYAIYEDRRGKSRC